MSTTTTHTPGPWSIAPSFAGQWIKAGKSYICPLPDHIEHDGKPCGSVASQDKTQAEINANAALIAAAPELLAALKSILGTAEVVDAGNKNQFGANCHGFAAEVFEQCRAAIAKATTLPTV